MSAAGNNLERLDLSPPNLSTGGRLIILFVAFAGWMFAGFEMNIIPLAGRPAIISFLSESSSEAPAEGTVGNWFAAYVCAFLLGAAAGGLLFGRLGYHIGGSKAMAASILCYSLVTGVSYFVTSLEQLLVLRFVACLGIGGMWPNGVALASEAWSDGSRPLLAGLIGTAANVGFVLLGLLAKYHRVVTPDDWRWVFAYGGLPAILGILSLAIVPESPRWLARRHINGDDGRPTTMSTIFRPPYLGATIIGICLGTVPLLGGWGTLNWTIPWADQVGGADDPRLKATISICRSSGAALGSLIGGWLASQFGRRSTYFAISLASLLSSGYLFWFLTPEMESFTFWVFVLGFFGTIYFGWLPLYLPELFPTHVRATGSGVTFNFGRIVSAAGVLVTGNLVSAFHGDYAQVGRCTHLIYLLGMVVILFAPDTSGRRLDE